MKIGLIAGLLLAAAIVFKLATDPRLSTQARMTQLHNAAASQDLNEPVSDFLQDQTLVTSSRQVPLENTLSQSVVGGDGYGGSLESVTNLQSIPANLETIEGSGQNDQPQYNVDVSQHEPAEKIKTQKFHIVRKGETLSVISNTYFGTPNKWKKIYDTNRGVIKNPDKIIPGTKIFIPDE